MNTTNSTSDKNGIPANSEQIIVEATVVAPLLVATISAKSRRDTLATLGLC